MYLSNKMECFSYKGGCGVCERICIEAFKRRAGLGCVRVNTVQYMVVNFREDKIFMDFI